MPSDYALDYAAVLIATLIGLGIVISAFVLSRLLAPRSPSREKSIVYECGMIPVGQFWSQVHIRYYLFAILFMIFDVETVFLFPWAVTFIGGGAAIFYEMFLFIAILFFGLVFAWRKGVLRWK
ncbi:MAG: NADH-quinone oxidoreductase subunit A [Dehalococcoidia bacterium]